MALFTTSRLTIREITGSDLSQLAPILSDAFTMRYTATGAQKPEQMKAFVQRCLRQYSEQEFGHWAIFVTGTQQLIGLCGLNRHQVDDEELVHVNYRLGSQCQGRGFATEAVTGLMGFCSEAFNIRRLSAIIEPSNTSSIKVVERLGFEFSRRTEFKNLQVNIYGKWL
ncbi:GNAT family N-acetyltransferase [Bowmanella dokdonensis]|uniref:GNAT family N-acetyltransferase n=1 Tax=Bowmanella dokdonensis TaxID=751969 RepID=A0A939IQT5_9ALTE|nr:GNAT family N-acetyltransferase [Bowmanella dokdonensis]MBN7825404.1 GNAT family N-acetyltransferase [Bowmanella dokdonensis]